MLIPSLYNSEVGRPHLLWRLGGKRSLFLQLGSGQPCTTALIRQ